MASKTVKEKSMGRPIRNASAAMAQTALTGVPVHQLIAAHTLYSGTPPSRLKLHSTLCMAWEPLAETVKRPSRHCAWQSRRSRDLQPAPCSKYSILCQRSPGSTH